MTTANRTAPSGPGGDASALFAERYRAMSSRDARFDGQFITGVHSTGIYCRPSCPATTPKPSNVSFYLTAAAAHEAGLRACKRCLPDAVPGSPEWNLRDDTAARAMRLITDGVVEREGVDGLAARLGYTSRHLGRILVGELGAGPLALARANRAQTARALLVSTELPVTDVAYAAGFSSIRQFNATIAEVYERTPSQLRALARGRGAAAHERAAAAERMHRVTTDRGPDDRVVSGPDAGLDAGADSAGPTTVTLRLPARPPFDGAGVLRFLADRVVAGVETAAAPESGAERSSPGSLVYTRSLRLPGGPAVVELTAPDDHDGLLCHATVSTLADLGPLVARIRRLVDLDADAAAIDDALAEDPALAPLVAAAPGIRLPGAVDAHEIVLRALLGQQVSVAAARTALGRLTAELGEPLPWRHAPRRATTPSATSPAVEGASVALVVDRLFPSAASIAEHGRDLLRGPAARIDTVLRVSAMLASGELRLDLAERRVDLAEQLLAVRGIGPWTAGYIAMRVSGDPDVLLTSDLVLRQGAAALGLPAEAGALERHGARWAPWRSYAGLHLWRAADAAKRTTSTPRNASRVRSRSATMEG